MFENYFLLKTYLLFQHTSGIYGYRLAEQFEVGETHCGNGRLKLYLGRIKRHYPFVTAEVQLPVFIFKSGFETKIVIKTGDKTHLIIILLNTHDSFLSACPDVPVFVFQQAYGVTALHISPIHRNRFKF